MDKQLHQLVVASVIALLTSGTITLVGLSAAEEMHMEGGGTPTPSNTSYSPSPESGGTYQQPSGTTNTAPTNTNTAPVYQDSGTIYHQQPAGDWSQRSGSPEGNWSEHSRQPSGGSANYQGGDHTGSSGQWGVGVGGGQRDGAGFQKDGADFQMHGKNYQKDGKDYQKDGMNFQKDWGHGGTKAPAGMGNESHMGRFGDSDRGDSSGAGHMGEMGNKAGGKKKMQDMSDFGDDNAGPGHEQMKKFMHGAPGGFGDHEDASSAFDQYIRGRKAQSASDQVSEEDLNALDDVLADDEDSITAEEALDALKAAVVEVKEYQSDLKDAKAAVKDLVKDDKTLDQLVAKIEQKYGDVDEAPATVVAKVDGLQEEVVEAKQNIDTALTSIGSDIEATRAQVEQLKAEIADSDLPQEAKLLKQCDTLLQQLTKVDTGFGKLEQKVDHVEVEEHA